MLTPKRIVYRTLKRSFGQWKEQSNRHLDTLVSHTEEIDLRRALSYGEAGHDPGKWAEITGNMHRASMLLADSPHVKLLEQYQAIGEALFLWKNFKQTAYLKNAKECVQIIGHYFGQSTVEGILAQARSFVTLYERILTGNSTEVIFPSKEGHSPPGSLPVVRKTWTPNTVQIDDGMHRLATTWVLGRQKTMALVHPSLPTKLQSLVEEVAQTQGRTGLHQPIDSVEFDSSWTLVRRCNDRLNMMLRFLARYRHHLSELSVVDLGCSYGWFVAEFSKRGGNAVGVDIDPEALKIGQIAYGLRAEQLVKSDLKSFLDNCNRTYDVVLLLSTLHHFVLKPDFGSPEEILRRIDAITGSVLFLDTGQAHERWLHGSLSEWNNDFIIRFIKQHTSFNRVLPLGRDSDNVGSFQSNYGRTLFACVRNL